MTSTTLPAGPSELTLARRHLAAAVALGALAAALTTIVVEAAAIMRIGGSCATGGPFEVTQRCPGHSVALLPAGFLGGVVAGLSHVWFGRGPGPKPIALSLPALLLALGWGFVDTALGPNASDVNVVAYLAVATVFGVLGGLPLWCLICNPPARTWVTGRLDLESNRFRRARRQLVTLDVVTTMLGIAAACAATT